MKWIPKLERSTTWNPGRTMYRVQGWQWGSYEDSPGRAIKVWLSYNWLCFRRFFNPPHRWLEECPWYQRVCIRANQWVLNTWDKTPWQRAKHWERAYRTTFIEWRRTAEALKSLEYYHNNLVASYRLRFESQEKTILEMAKRYSPAPQIVISKEQYDKGRGVE